MYYTIKPNSRAACLSRIEAARKVTAPLHWYGSDGEGRHKVRVIGPNDRKNDLLGAFRDARPVHEVMRAAERRGEVYARNIHNGWYTDPDGSSCKDGTGLCWGMVAYVGHGRWLAGYEHGGTDCGGYHLDAFYDSEMDAARAADELARIAAERECEYQERWQAARQIEDSIAGNCQRLAECLALRNDPRPCFAGLRDEARELIESIRADREELTRDYAGVL